MQYIAEFIINRERGQTQIYNFFIFAQKCNHKSPICNEVMDKYESHKNVGHELEHKAKQ